MSEKSVFRRLFPKMFYYSFVFSYVLIIVFTFVTMFFTANGVVKVCEPNATIRVGEILIGVFLLGYTLLSMKREIIDHIRGVYTKQ